MAKLHFYNTHFRKLEEFVPINPKEVTLYTCGPTVYFDAHIGNLKIYVEWDLLTRSLKYLGYGVKRVMNTTDVGQMTSDADLGEDKMMKALKREKEKGKEITGQEIADMYTELFLHDADSLNIERPTVISPATKHIPEMIALIKMLEEKGFAYKTEHAVYFDVSKFPKYFEFSGQKLDDKNVGVRDEVVVDPDKRNPADFRMWQLDQESVMMWDSPWGKGFPGWHIECSAMAMKYLGDTIDIHTGGIDHITIHHPNEIAQSEAATGKPLAHYWLHGEFLKVNNKKMSKSAGTFYVLKDIIDKGFDPLDFRYFALQAHYRFPQNFTWESLEGARSARQLINEQAAILLTLTHEKTLPDVSGHELKERFAAFLADDLNSPGALSVMWEVVKRKELPNEVRLALLFDFDQVLGLRLEKTDTIYTEFSKDEIAEINELLNDRENAKKAKDWSKADELRNRLTEESVRIIDTPAGAVPLPL